MGAVGFGVVLLLVVLLSCWALGVWGCVRVWAVVWWGWWFGGCVWWACCVGGGRCVCGVCVARGVLVLVGLLCWGVEGGCSPLRVWTSGFPPGNSLPLVPRD